MKGSIKRVRNPGYWGFCDCCRGNDGRVRRYGYICAAVKAKEFHAGVKEAFRKLDAMPREKGRW